MACEWPVCGEEIPAHGFQATNQMVEWSRPPWNDESVGEDVPKTETSNHNAEVPYRDLGPEENDEMGVERSILGISTSSMAEFGWQVWAFGRAARSMAR